MLAVQNKRIFGRNKVEIENLKLENSRLQQSIEENQSNQNKWSYNLPKGQDAIATFEQKLNGAIAATNELTKSETKTTTIPLWR